MLPVPDRLSVEKDSPYYNEAVLRCVPIVMFNGVKQTRVVEYCISEGWVRRHVGTVGKAPKNRAGKFLAFKASGDV